jgi:hypothetical protein
MTDPLSPSEARQEPAPNEMKCHRGHLQRQRDCPACHDAVSLFNGWMGYGFTAVPPVPPCAAEAQNSTLRIKAESDLAAARAEVEKLRGQLEACEKHLAIKEAVIQDLGQLAARLSHDRP